MHIRLRPYTQLDEKNDHLLQIYKSWVFKCVAVAVAVVVVVAVAVAPASAANKTFIFKCVKCLRNIIMILFHIFTLNSGSGNGNGHTFKDPAKVFILFSYLFVEFDKFWLECEPRDIMEFNRIRDIFESNLRSQLQENNIHLFYILIILFEKNNLLVILENLKTSLFLRILFKNNWKPGGKEVSFVKFTVG